jgi:hypothetical protein
MYLYIPVHMKGLINFRSEIVPYLAHETIIKCMLNVNPLLTLRE